MYIFHKVPTSASGLRSRKAIYTQPQNPKSITLGTHYQCDNELHLRDAKNIVSYSLKYHEFNDIAHGKSGIKFHINYILTLHINYNGDMRIQNLKYAYQTDADHDIRLIKKAQA